MLTDTGVLIAESLPRDSLEIMSFPLAEVGPPLLQILCPLVVAVIAGKETDQLWYYRLHG